MLTEGLAAHIAARLGTAIGGAGYLILDDLLPTDRAREIAEAFPVGRSPYTRLGSFRERKWTSNAFDALPQPLGHIAFALQAPEVIAEIERITGMDGLDPDPTSYAGGVSIMDRGDFLNPHIDNSHDRTGTLYRRVNLLYYPNPEWQHGAGGELELWDKKVRTATCIAPAFNRLVIMETHRTSWHSVAPVMRGPRRCVSSYCFSSASSDGRSYSHITSFAGRPGQPLGRAFVKVDNAARTIARLLGARRNTDRVYAGQRSNAMRQEGGN